MGRARCRCGEQARARRSARARWWAFRENLSAALSEHCRQRGFARVTERGDGPCPSDPLLVREALTGTAPPREAKRMSIGRPT